MNRFKLSDEILNKTLEEKIPSTGKFKIDKPLKRHKWFLKPHFIERVNERLIQNIDFKDRDTLIKMCIEMQRKSKPFHYKTSLKNKNNYIIETFLGEIPIFVVLSYNEINENYSALTMYVSLNEEMVTKIIRLFGEKSKEAEFLKSMNDKFYKGITEEELLDSLSIDKVEKKFQPKEEKVKGKNYITNMDQIIMEDLEEEINNIVISEPEDNLYTRDEETQIGFGLTSEDFPWDN